MLSNVNNKSFTLIRIKIFFFWVRFSLQKIYLSPPSSLSKREICFGYEKVSPTLGYSPLFSCGCNIDLFLNHGSCMK